MQTGVKVVVVVVVDVVVVVGAVVEADSHAAVTDAEPMTRCVSDMLPK